MRELLEVVRRVALADLPVLITGESGTGKELVARAVHHCSPRAAKPWIDVCCAALPEHLIESELFGHEKGAFSGADTAKQGLFELADGGTILLDEIAELEPRMQAKLLRVLDGESYFRLGGVRKVLVDVRVVAATNRNLAVREGNGFRLDLYHRLSQIHLEVPPLRERREDIVPLAKHFLRQCNPGLELTREACLLLERHDWPGNVRELRNVTAKAALLARHSSIGASDVAVAGGAGYREAEPPLAAAEELRLKRIERQAIFDALAVADGRKQQAAEMLGISLRTLNRKLRSYQMEAQRRGGAACSR